MKSLVMSSPSSSAVLSASLIFSPQSSANTVLVHSQKCLDFTKELNVQPKCTRMHTYMHAHTQSEKIIRLEK